MIIVNIFCHVQSVDIYQLQRIYIALKANCCFKVNRFRDCVISERLAQLYAHKTCALIDTHIHTDTEKNHQFISRLPQSSTSHSVMLYYYYQLKSLVDVGKLHLSLLRLQHVLKGKCNVDMAWFIGILSYIEKTNRADTVR